MMIIEFARDVAGIEDADSTEFDRYASEPVIDLMEEQKGVTEKGATMRLGEYDCVLSPGSKAYEAYAESGLGQDSDNGELKIKERHRHRYEYNNAYRDQLERLGLLSSGFNPGLSLVEIAEIADHPFMVGSQFHPEFPISTRKTSPVVRPVRKLRSSLPTGRHTTAIVRGCSYRSKLISPQLLRMKRDLCKTSTAGLRRFGFPPPCGGNVRRTKGARRDCVAPGPSGFRLSPE